MPLRVLYIDDVRDDLDQYSERLMRTRELEVDCRVPPEDMDIDPLLSLDPALVLVDYDLTKLTDERTKAKYLGGSLLTLFREKRPDLPLVLFTRKALWEKHSRVVESLDVLDDVVFKDAVETDYRIVASHLACLVRGFEQLRACNRTWPSLLNVLGAVSQVEEDLIRQAAPPMARSTWEVPQTARWIRRVLLAYPGIVYDALHASVFLGLDTAAFSTSEVQSLLKPARYDGCFSCDETRWWKSRLLDIAKTLELEKGLHGPINAVFREAFVPELTPSRCIYSKEVPADWVCYVQKAPVKMKFSLPYYVDNRPAVMDEARVSFEAILHSNEVDEDLLDAASKATVQELRKRRWFGWNRAK